MYNFLTNKSAACKSRWLTWCCDMAEIQNSKSFRHHY